jgi:hypothetical protein
MAHPLNNQAPDLTAFMSNANPLDWGSLSDMPDFDFDDWLGH